MSFDPKKLPSKVYEAYKMGVMAWPLVIQEALDAGILDLNKLTDIVFYLHYPDLRGRSLTADDSELIKKWKLYRGLVASRHAGYMRGKNDPMGGKNDPAQMFQQIMQQLTQGGD